MAHEMFDTGGWSTKGPYTTIPAVSRLCCVGLSRRTLLGLLSGTATAFAGCLEAPSSSPPPYETREIDDGPFYKPGLQNELSLAFFASLVTSDAEAREFDLQALARERDRAFIEATDYRTSYLGVVQVSGLNSSSSIWLVDLAAAPDQLGLVLGVEDNPPHSDDRVITTFLVRVQKERPSPPDGIWVQLSIGDRREHFTGD